MFWGEHPYYTLNHYFQNQFGEKIYKLAINAGLTCPNRDGTIDTRGCVFCSEGGSGDFTPSKELSITNQIEIAKTRLSSKKTGSKYIAYFQAFTNTYAPIEYLRKIFIEAINHTDIIGISISTRPDCINEEVVSLLFELNMQKKVFVELGLQTIHNTTANLIRRGYDLDCFEKSLSLLNKYNLDTIIHLILGLPYETEKEMLKTIDYISKLSIHGVKLQLLHVLKGTDLEKLYYNNKFKVLSKKDYISILIKCIEKLPPHFVIHRITGDGPKKLLIAPLWSSDKKRVLNDINKTFKNQQAFQGRLFK